MGIGKISAKKYEELCVKYQELFGQKAELEYRLRELQEENEYIRKQDAEIKNLHQNVRQLKHDMKNHFMVIASYLNEENYACTKEYVSQVLGKLNTMHSYVETGNSLLNHILNEKLEYAKGRGIAVKAEIENLAFAGIKSIDFSALLSNMLDNAIEASEKESSPEVRICIKKKRGYETISLKNKISQSVLKKNPHLQTSKENAVGHGMGVLKIKTIVDTYGGMYDFYEEDGFFCVSVFLPQ